MLKKFIIITTLVLPGAVLAQTPAQPPVSEAAISQPDPAGEFRMISEITVGGIAGADEDSAKFDEYRDISDGAYLFHLRMLGHFGGTADYVEATGSNVGRDDQFFSLRGGRHGTWRGGVEIDSLPHRLTRDAFSPYTYAGGGLFTVPDVVGILTTTASNSFLPSDMLENDRRIDTYLDRYIQPLPELGTDNDRATLFFAYAPAPSFEARLSATRETREGEKISYGTLGDRPPRTLNVEIPEPIDYEETTLQFDAAYAGRYFDLTMEIFAPRFENKVDTMRWQSMYFGADSDGSPDYNNDVILAGNAIVRRAVSTFGQRALPPDNDATNVTFSFGMDTAMSGRLMATAGVGRMRQDMSLLPYSYSSLTTDWDSTAKLPRLEADAAIDTLVVDVQYPFVPMRGLRVRPYFRSYNLDNDTPQDNWWYVTQDTASNTTGSAIYKNKRTNLAYGFERQNLGIEANWQLRRLNLGGTVEQESVDRDFREANTDELVFRASASYRPVRWISLRGRYTFGDREAGTYDGTVTSNSYWYSPADVGTNLDDPRFAFTNHPDMRRYDVTDRKRNELDLSANFTPRETFAFSVSYIQRDQDFDSDVRPVQPLAGTSYAAADGVTPGVQLGLLNRDLSRLALDMNWTPGERWNATAFISLEQMDLVQRSMAYNENTRISEQSSQLGSPGQAWTDSRSIWRGEHDDTTQTVGVGFNYTFIPDRLTLNADYTFSNGEVDIDYSGYGSDQPLTTVYFAWRSPEIAEQVQHIASLGVEYRIQRGFIVGLRYLYDDYSIKDWMQEPSGGWVDVVDEYFIRDSTLDNRWGNRLPRLGGYLAPSYGANVAFLTLGYNW